jgi:hypothetical protein
MGANGKMQYNLGWESGSMKTLAAHGLAGGIVQDRMGGSFGAGFLSGSPYKKPMDVYQESIKLN